MMTDAATMDMWLKDYLGAMTEADPSMPGYIECEALTQLIHPGHIAY